MCYATYVRCPGRTSEGVEMSRETVRIVIVACLVSGAPVLAQGQAQAPRSPAAAERGR